MRDSQGSVTELENGRQARQINRRLCSTVIRAKIETKVCRESSGILGHKIRRDL